MASSTNSAGTIEHELRMRLRPVVESATREILAPQLAAGLDVRVAALQTKLDAIMEGVNMANTTGNAILSSQEIARRFEATREEVLIRLDAHEADVAVSHEQIMQMLADRITDFEAAIDARVATLEALSFWTLLRLAARRLVGR